jgi:hypothetical protein
MTLALAAQDAGTPPASPRPAHHAEDRRPGPLVLPRQDRPRERSGVAIPPAADAPLGMGSPVADAGSRIVARLGVPG